MFTLEDGMRNYIRGPRPLTVSKDPISLEELAELVRDPGSKFAMTPDHVTTFAAFMFKQGLTKTKPDSWKDMFFPEVHDQPGS